MQETHIHLVLDGKVGNTEDLTRILGHDVKSVTTEVKNVPDPWRLGESHGEASGYWRYIEAQDVLTPKGVWREIGLVRYLTGDRADIYQFTLRDQLQPLFWLNQPGSTINRRVAMIYDSWAAR
jgi:hypothetical protein